MYVQYYAVAQNEYVPFISYFMIKDFLQIVAKPFWLRSPNKTNKNTNFNFA